MFDVVWLDECLLLCLKQSAELISSICVCARACARACRGCTEFACYVMFDEPRDSWFVCLMLAAVICEPFIKLQSMVFVLCELFLPASAGDVCFHASVSTCDMFWHSHQQKNFARVRRQFLFSYLNHAAFLPACSVSS